MKRLLTIIFICCLSTTWAQSLSPTVIASSGGYHEGANASLSWTLGELATETLDNGSNILTQGFQQPVEGIALGIDLDLLVFLEGPFNASQMNTNLNSSGILPLTQPYNSLPWNYSGTESVTSIPGPEVVDWVLIELRDAADAASATSATRLARQAAFLLNDGSVVGMDGASVLQFSNTFTQQLFVIVWHRNHLGIMSANGVTASGGIYSYNFTLSASQVYGGSAGYNNLNGTVWGMIAGDANHDNMVSLSDKTLWSSFAGSKGYQSVDFSMDAQINNKDKNDVVIPNSGRLSQVPD
jgi:hypothetical protein